MRRRRKANEWGMSHRLHVCGKGESPSIKSLQRKCGSQELMWVDESLLTDPVMNVTMVIGWWERDKRNPRKAVNAHKILFDLTAKCLPLLLLPSLTLPSAIILPRQSLGHVWGPPFQL